jgi:cobalt-zinc-cadmium resistance protein CzcA
MNTSEHVEPGPDTLPVIDPPRRETFNAASNPLARVLESEERASAKNLGITRQGFLPDFTVALRRQFLLPGYNPYDIPRERFAKGNFTGFEVGISLPLFFGEQRARTRAARRELEITRVRRQESLAALATEYSVALDDHSRATTALAYHLDAGRASAREVSRVAHLAYEQGEIGYVEYIQNLETAVAMHLQRAAAINEYNQSVIILNYLQGNL